MLNKIINLDVLTSNIRNNIFQDTIIFIAGQGDTSVRWSSDYIRKKLNLFCSL